MIASVKHKAQVAICASVARLATTSELSATEAAELLGLTRERLRQLAAAGELPDRLPLSSKFRPRYRRSDMEAYGRATGRIVDRKPPPQMELVVDELMTRSQASLWLGEPPVAHVRVWERDGWLPIVVLGAPLDGDQSVRSDVFAWEVEVRERFLPDVPFMSLWLLMPDHRPGWHEDGLPRYLERSDPTTWRGSDRDRYATWIERSHADLEGAVGGPVAQFHSAVYTRDVIARVQAAGGEMVEVEWDPYDLAGLAEAARVLAEHAESESLDDGRAMLEAAWFIGSAARAVEESGRGSAPSSTNLVEMRAVELPDSSWKRLDQLAREAREHPWDANAGHRELDRLRRELERLLESRGDAMPWRLRQAVSRALDFVPNVGDLDA